MCHWLTRTPLWLIKLIFELCKNLKPKELDSDSKSQINASFGWVSLAAQTSLRSHLHMKNTKAERWDACRWGYSSVNHPLTRGPAGGGCHSVRANLHQIDNKCLLPQSCSSPLKWKIIQIRYDAKWQRSFRYFLGCHQSHPVGWTHPPQHVWECFLLGEEWIV